jgi:hypothetical protein
MDRAWRSVGSGCVPNLLFLQLPSSQKLTSSAKRTTLAAHDAVFHAKDRLGIWNHFRGCIPTARTFVHLRIASRRKDHYRLAGLSSGRAGFALAGWITEFQGPSDQPFLVHPLKGFHTLATEDKE